ncbi:MAG TPA: inner membrane CreD family protein [Gemmatimonadaceae bacterium]|nr:inner membrane CreD family protein [Gemmatimonadaceae bacterium]
MAKRIAAIVFIYLCATAAWAVLGATIFARTYHAGSTTRESVAASWGTAQEQAAPTATAERTVLREERSEENGHTVVRTVQDVAHDELPLERSRVSAAFDLDHRQKGLLWYSTYTVDFAGRYRFRNTSTSDSVRFTLPFPSKDAVYDGLVFTVNGAPVPTTNADGLLVGRAVVPSGETVELAVGYRSQGLDSWRYAFGAEVAQVRDFELRMRTDFDRIDVPPNTLSPTTKERSGDGWLLTWRYASLLSGYEVGMTMPQKLQPGPLAGRISLFAPVSLLFFFLVLFLITTVRGIELHPMNYFFLAAAFFSFHLLLAYLVDHISIHLAFAVASAVSIALVVSYLRLVVGSRFALREAALAQLVYLVLFSYAFFFEGFTGLAVTIGSVLTLFVVMQMTGRVRWSVLFAARAAEARSRPFGPLAS